MSDALSELFRIARNYGRVRIMTMSNGKYYCAIEFDTIQHVQLEAKSSFVCDTPEEAVKAATEKAQEIIKSLHNQYQNLAERKLLSK